MTIRLRRPPDPPRAVQELPQEILAWIEDVNRWQVEVWKQLYTEGGQSHTILSDIGTNTHPQIDDHIADSTIHFTVGSIKHSEIQEIGTNTHAQIDTHIADGSIHFTKYAEVPWREVDADYTVVAEDVAIRVDMSSGDVTLTLPAVTSGKRFYFSRSGASNTLTLSPDGTDTIMGESSETIDVDGDAIILIGDATNNDWRVA